MSNYHVFGAGKVAMVGGSTGGKSFILAMSDLDEPGEMDVEVDASGDSIPMHSTVMEFPTKESFDRYVRNITDMAKDFKWAT